MGWHIIGPLGVFLYNLGFQTHHLYLFLNSREYWWVGFLEPPFCLFPTKLILIQPKIKSLFSFACLGFYNICSTLILFTSLCPLR